MKCLKSLKDQCALTERERDGERSDSETLSVLLMQSILLLFIPLTAPGCVFCPSRLPNSFHLLDLDLTWSQTAWSDKATVRLCSSKGVLFYRQRDRDTTFLAIFLQRTTGNAMSDCIYLKNRLDFLNTNARIKHRCAVRCTISHFGSRFAFVTPRFIQDYRLKNVSFYQDCFDDSGCLLATMLKLALIHEVI